MNAVPSFRVNNDLLLMNVFLFFFISELMTLCEYIVCCGQELVPTTQVLSCFGEHGKEKIIKIKVGLNLCRLILA